MAPTNPPSLTNGIHRSTYCHSNQCYSKYPFKLGQTDTDGTLYDIATITLYNGAYISFEIGGFDMTFEVSEDTADYLNGYFE